MVTGASTGIGLAVCEALAAEGAVVVGGARNVAERSVDSVEHLTPIFHRAGLVAVCRSANAPSW